MVANALRSLVEFTSATANSFGLADQDRRVYARPGVRFPATLDVEGWRIPVSGRNFNRSGAMVVSPVAIQPLSLVFFYATKYQLLGWATVRWCSKAGAATYYVGLEFRSSLMRAEAGEWQFSRTAASALEVAETAQLESQS